MGFNWGAVDPLVVCRTLEPFLAQERRARIDTVIEGRLGGLAMLIENLHDPHNGAAVLRSAEGFGIQTVHVVEAAEKFRFSSDVTQGCEKWLDIVRHPTFEAAHAQLRFKGFALYAAVPDAPVRLEDLDFRRPAAVLIGNEHAGLSAAAVAAVDVSFSIPMAGMTRSLNLSVAAALVGFHGAAARRAALGCPGDLSDDARLLLRARYYAASVRGAEQIVARHLASS